MTTIAVRFSTGEMAADTLVSADGILYNTSKVRKMKTGYVGAAGDWQHVVQFFERLPEGKPLENDCNIDAIELRADGIYVYEQSIVPCRINQDFFAIGSGCGYAIAAMHYGKSPKEAVELAVMYDRNTRGPIEVFTLGESNGTTTSRRRKTS